MTRAEMKEMFRGVAEHSRHLAEVTPLEVDRAYEAYSEVVKQALPVYQEILRLVGRQVSEAVAEAKRAFRTARREIQETRPDSYYPQSFPLQEARAQFGRRVKEIYKESDRVVKLLDEVYRETIAPIARHSAEAKLKAGMITRDLYDYFWGSSTSEEEK